MTTQSTMLQLPTDIVRNINYNIDEKAFAIYAYLTFRRYKKFGAKTVRVMIKDVKIVTGIADNRTVKRCFKTLYDNNLIKNDLSNFPINKQVEIEFNDSFTPNFFTQLPLQLLRDIHHIGIIGYRLMYYYESYINRTNVTKLFCFPSYETIEGDLKLSNTTITKYNKLLNEENLLTVTRHKSEYDPFSDSGFEKYNNHYHVNIEETKQPRREFARL